VFGCCRREDAPGIEEEGGHSRDCGARRDPVRAAPAQASTVTVAGSDTVRVTETGNEANQIRVSFDAGADLYTVLDAASTLTPSGTCVMVDGHTATCPGTSIETVSVQTGDRDDTIALDATTIRGTIKESLDGGSGNDTVTGAIRPAPSAADRETTA
jgi:Ca2+-binding RTX toxin-like protein